MHFGRGTAAAERAKEAALIECLEAHAETVEHLYLVGDIFDGYIEYRNLVPKGFVRFQAVLARWTDRGTPVTYLVGNHDPWHRDYFSEELGIRLVSGALDVTYDHRRLHLTHGDEWASTHPLYSWLRRVLRHPKAIQLYCSLLPADLGLGLARRISRLLHDETPDPAVVSTLRDRAQAHLARDATDLVVVGHSHVPALHEWSDGIYLNTGNWYEKRTFGRLDDTGVYLSRWNGTRTVDIEAVTL